MPSTAVRLANRAAAAARCPQACPLRLGRRSMLPPATVKFDQPERPPGKSGWKSIAWFLGTIRETEGQHRGRDQGIHWDAEGRDRGNYWDVEDTGS